MRQNRPLPHHPIGQASLAQLLCWTVDCRPREVYGIRLGLRSERCIGRCRDQGTAQNIWYVKLDDTHRFLPSLLDRPLQG